MGRAVSDGDGGRRPTHELAIAASVGIRLSSTEQQSLPDFLRDAEQLRREADERRSVESGLRRALRDDELVLHYQPLVSLKTGAALSVEARS